MKLRAVVAFAVLAISVSAPARGADVVVGPGGGTPGTSENFELIAHNPLYGRGMNAALAFYGDHIYVGNRTDGSSRCGAGDPRIDTTGPDSCPHVHPGILVLDATDPADPTIVGEFATEFTTGANEGQTARELRVWPDQGLLMVMYFRCSAVIHACPPSADVWSVKFFDVAADPVNPPLIATYVPSQKPHEMYLWIDPKDEDRALLWLSTPTTSVDPSRDNLVITDISNAREGEFIEIAKGNWNSLYPGSEDPANYDFDLALHSMGVSVDGTTTHLAHLRGHYLTLDTTEVANGNPPPGEMFSLDDNLLTPVENRPQWGTASGGCLKECAEAHSAVPLLGRPFVLVTDEVYGTFTASSFGCPWGWARLISTNRPGQPIIVGEYKIRQNESSFCGSPEDDPATEQFTSYSSHNPTVLRRQAFITWHSGGLQALGLSNPAVPTQTGWFSPTPLDSVATEDPALSRGPNKVVMWSYPIIKDGLIYVIDIRNGLYVLRYTGLRDFEVRRIKFIEGNSNLGDAARLDGFE